MKLKAWISPTIFLILLWWSLTGGVDSGQQQSYMQFTQTGPAAQQTLPPPRAQPDQPTQQFSYRLPPMSSSIQFMPGNQSNIQGIDLLSNPDTTAQAGELIGWLIESLYWSMICKHYPDQSCTLLTQCVWYVYEYVGVRKEILKCFSSGAIVLLFTEVLCHK